MSIPAATQTTRVARGSAAKTRGTALKKRAATTNEQSASKRQKSSDVSNSMPVAKPKSKPGTSKSKSKPAKLIEEHAPVEPAEGVASQAVPLFSSSTSMEKLSAPSQQTSFDAVRASKGYGMTLYHGFDAISNAPSSSIISQPWLEKSGTKDIQMNRSDASTNAGKADKDLEASDGQNDDPAKPIGGRMRSLRTLSEDFMLGGDDELEDAMALIELPEAKSTQSQQAKSVSHTQTSRGLQESKAKKMQRSRKPVLPVDSNVTSSRTLSENFMIGDDEDMVEALTSAVELQLIRDTQNKQTQASTKIRTSLGIAESSRFKSPLRTVSKDPRDDKAPAQAALGTSARSGNEAECVEDISSPADGQRPQTPLTRQRKLNMRDVDANENYGGALFSEAEKKILGMVFRASSSFASFRSHFAHNCELLANSHSDSLKASPDSAIKPIVRTAFPRPILDRSPLFGASTKTTLRTCFRIGEALKEGSAAVRSNYNIIIELYARVKSSHREGRKQHFVFHDLYHHRPPYIEGTCELWNHTNIWELDTRSFVSADKRPEGVMCRAVARMKRKDTAEGKGWRLEVLSIWEASWSDIDFVAGIYGKGRDEVVADDD